MQKARSGVEVSGDFNSSEFSMDDNVKILEMMIDSYSNQELAVVREYCCNAYDEHVFCGIEDTPIKVHIPTNSDPEFRVRDYGRGMSPEFMTKTFTRIGKSTKDGSEDNASAAVQTGGFGIGRMVGFAAAEQFYITCIHEGQRAEYLCTWDRVEKPQILQLGDLSPTDEPNGTEVRIPVSSDKVWSYKHASEKCFKHFPTQPNINIEISKPDEYLWSGDAWGLRSGNGWSASQRVIMGVVAYPLDVSALRDQFSKEEYEFFNDAALDIIVPLGSVELLISRESIRYRNRTIRVLTKALRRARQELRETVEAELDSDLSPYEQLIVANKVASKLPKNTLGNGKNNAKSMQLPDGVDVRVAGNYSLRNHKNPRLEYHRNYEFMPNDDIVFVFDDLGHNKRQPSRIWRKYAKTQATVLYFETPPDLKDLGDPDPSRIVYTSSLEAPPRMASDSSRSYAGVKLRKAVHAITDAYDVKVRTEIIDFDDIDDETVYYVETYQGSPSVHFYPNNVAGIESVILVPRTLAAKRPDNWVSYADACREISEAKLTELDWDTLICTQADMPWQLTRWVTDNRGFVDAYVACRSKGNEYQLLKRVCTRLDNKATSDSYTNICTHLSDRSAHRIRQAIRKENEVIEGYLKKVETSKPLLHWFMTNEVPYRMNRSVLAQLTSLF
jgi:hypothetical protein